MSGKTMGSLLMATGAVVGLTATAAVFLGLFPTHGSSFLVAVGLYKLTFISSGTLMASGALVGRWARRAEARQIQQREAELALLRDK
ncbi:MAG: hypothetical protein ABI852_20310 [Gemmatimonadaceae bacterium]